MDICSLGFTHFETKQTGRMPYDPVDMIKLYTYSYFNGIRSSRKIEKECHRKEKAKVNRDLTRSDMK